LVIAQVGERNDMSYRLDLDEPIPRTLRDVATERLERAVRRLREEHGDDPVEAVHGARKDLKKARALLRLARPGMPSDAYRRENRALRDIGRAMSGGRDADVMVETSDALAERFGNSREFAALHRRLAANARGRQDAADVEALTDSLRDAAERAASWPFDDCDLATLQAGEKRAYRDGRREFADARADPSAERLHEWRKRVKDLWYHHRLLAKAWRGPMKAHADECDKLGGLLGDDHDLVTLAATLTAGDGVDAPPSVDVEALTALIERRREELQAEAFAIAARLYAEKPKAHARRIGAYLAAGERQLA
jgi:CHAD domain-containing protein